MATIREKEIALRKYRDIDLAIQNLTDRYEELYTKSTKITPSYSDHSGSGGGFDGSKVENACIKLLEIDNQRKKLCEQKAKVERELKKLTYHQRKVVEFIGIEEHTIYHASKFFRQTYINTKVSYENALKKMDI